MTPLEIISLLFALLLLVKVTFIIFSKSTWYKKVALPIYKHSSFSGFVIFFLSLVILYYVLLSLTLIEIFSVMALTSMLMALGFMFYSKEVIEMVKKIYSKKFKFSFVGILYLLLWVLLALLVIYQILF